MKGNWVTWDAPLDQGDSFLLLFLISRWTWFLFYRLPFTGKKSYGKKQLFSTLLYLTQVWICAYFLVRRCPIPSHRITWNIAWSWEVTYNVALLSVLGNEIHFFAKRKSLSPRIGNLRWRRFRGDRDRTGRASLEQRLLSLPSKIRTLRSQWTQVDGALEDYRRGKYGYA